MVVLGLGEDGGGVVEEEDDVGEFERDDECSFLLLPSLRSSSTAWAALLRAVLTFVPREIRVSSRLTTICSVDRMASCVRLCVSVCNCSF